MRYSPNEVGATVFTERMAKLADDYPEFLARLEAEEEDKARPALALRGQTPEEVAAAEAEERARAEAEREAVAAEEAAKKAAEKQSLDDAIKKRAENPDNFQFGEDGKAAAKPMGGLFEQPSAEPSAQPTSRATSGSQPEAVPPAVLSRIRIALNRLREVERELAGVERARGRGHILALELRDKQAVIDAARAKIADFRVIASGRGIDADAVIDELGGEPDFGRFGEPSPVAEPTPAAAPVAERETPPDAPQQQAKLPPRSFRKSQTVKIKAFDADSGKLVDHEVDADTALNSLQADIDALEAFRACIAGG